ncbi:hypothetical protein Ahy_A10g048739 [Arachis hypogaea]|uniref:Uncharacterized protein n=1 Tax=Arachis hypogaea TaxID=3818 RepID=A0A445B5S2_ARAHY|nr:hypothetical protein Ahy_A10g048739 [Arachis hypogaea]
MKWLRSSDESVAFLILVYIRTILVYCENFSVYLQFLCDVDEQFVPKVGMNFNKLEDVVKFYKDYSKVAGPKEEAHTYQEQSRRASVGAKKRFDDLVFWLQNIYEFASEFEEPATILYRAYDNAMVEMQEYKAKSKKKCSLSHEDEYRLGSKTEKQITNASKKKNESSKRGKSDIL